MQIEYAFFALGAEVTSNNKLFVFAGDFDSLQCSELPGVIPPISLVIKLSVAPEEAQSTHTIRIEISHPNGVRFRPNENQAISTIPNQIDPRRASGSRVIMQMALAFEVAGQYGFHIIVDDQELKRLPLYIYGPNDHFPGVP